MTTLEICCGSLQSVRAAHEGGAQRVELCSGLSEGGVTPSLGLLVEAQAIGLPVHVLIRPRGGDFVYSPSEVRAMYTDIIIARLYGASGVVIGALTTDGDVDMEVCEQLVAATKAPLEDNTGLLRPECSITFHRAFDLCRDPHKALADIKQLGINRVLTSGQAQTAEKGIALLRQLVEEAGEDLSIMPGCGVSIDNVRRIIDETGAHEIHASLRSPIESNMLYHKEGVSMGTPGSNEYVWPETDPELVERAVRLFI